MAKVPYSLQQKIFLTLNIRRLSDPKFILLGAADPKDPLGDDLVESLPELHVEDAVDDGVKSAVAVSQPGQDLEHRGADTVLAQAGDDIDHEEGGPAQQEHPHDYPNGDGSLVLLQQRRVWDLGLLGLGSLGLDLGPFVVLSGLGRGIGLGQGIGLHPESDEGLAVLLYGLHVVPGEAVDVEVDQEHDQAGEEEADDGGEDGVARTEKKYFSST